MVKRLTFNRHTLQKPTYHCDVHLGGMRTQSGNGWTGNTTVGSKDESPEDKEMRKHESESSIMTLEFLDMCWGCREIDQTVRSCGGVTLGTFLPTSGCICRQLVNLGSRQQKSRCCEDWTQLWCDLWPTNSATQPFPLLSTRIHILFGAQLTRGQQKQLVVWRSVCPMWRHVHCVCVVCGRKGLHLDGLDEWESVHKKKKKKLSRKAIN